MTWHTRAACLDSEVDFFAQSSVKTALAICAGCPVTAECLQDAIDHGDLVGVRGGIHFGSIAAAWKTVRPKRVIEHGSEPGYRRHQRNGEVACEDCIRAHRRIHAEYRARGRVA